MAKAKSTKPPKIDKDVVARCLVYVLDDKAKGGVDHYRKRLRSDKYLRQVMRSPIGSVYRTFIPVRYF